MTAQSLARTHRSFDLVDTSPPGHDAGADAYARIRRSGKTRVAAFLKRFGRVLPTDWRILLWSKETDEPTLHPMDQSGSFTSPVAASRRPA